MDRPAIARGMRPNRPPLDDDSTARMLQGSVHPDDAPPGYGAVAGLLAAAARPVPVVEDVAATTVSAMVEAIRESASAPQTSRRKSMLTKLLAGKAALAALGVVALTASGAAAATGSLPTPVQNVVSGAASHVGVDLPHGNGGNSAGHRQDGVHRPSTDQTQAGEDDTTSSTDPGNDSHGKTVSSTAHQAQQDGNPVGPTVCAVASDGKCQAGQHGKGGSGDNGSTTSTTDGSSGDHHTPPTTGSIQTGEDHNNDHATTPTTASVQTGQDHSGDQATTPTTGSVQTGQDHSGH